MRYTSNYLHVTTTAFQNQIDLTVLRHHSTGVVEHCQLLLLMNGLSTNYLVDSGTKEVT